MSENSKKKKEKNSRIIETREVKSHRMISAWNEHTANERKIARVVKKYADKYGVDSV